MSLKTSNRSKSKANPRDRIVEAIGTLWYKNGYQSTGIRDILKAAGAHKASLYHYFEGKDDMLRAYLDYRRGVMQDFLSSIAARSPDARHFFRFWQAALYRSARAGELHGCPVANLNAELGEERERFRGDLLAVADAWRGTVRSFLRREHGARRIPAHVDIDEASRRLMMIHQGYVQTYALYRDPSVLETMAADMASALE